MCSETCAFRFLLFCQPVDRVMLMLPSFRYAIYLLSLYASLRLSTFSYFRLCLELFEGEGLIFFVPFCVGVGYL